MGYTLSKYMYYPPDEEIDELDQLEYHIMRVVDLLEQVQLRKEVKLTNYTHLEQLLLGLKVRRLQLEMTEKAKVL